MPEETLCPQCRSECTPAARDLPDEGDGIRRRWVYCFVGCGAYYVRVKEAGSVRWYRVGTMTFASRLGKE